MSEPIATRTLYAGDGDHVREILVSFKKPTQLDTGDWTCECTIEGNGLEIKAPRPGTGVDAVQAIIGALESVGSTLETSKLNLALTREPFLTGATPDPRQLGDYFPRRVEVMHGLADELKLLESST